MTPPPVPPAPCASMPAGRRSRAAVNLPIACRSSATRQATRLARPRRSSCARRSRARCWSPSTDRVLDTRVVSIPAEGKVIEIEVDPEWGAGAYVLASAFRPGKEQERGPGRAVGVAWLAVDASPRTIQVHMEVPDKVKPRQKVEIRTTLSNLSGATAYLTIAAVDEGILTLTDFESPDPV